MQYICQDCNLMDVCLVKGPTTRECDGFERKLSQQFFVNGDGGKKEKVDKVVWSELSLDKIEEVIRYGANKYGMENWKLVDKQEYKEAAFRHTKALLYGGPTDGESGLSHAAHAITNLMFLMYLEGVENEANKN